jgi:type IV secretion system protein VirD4
MKDAEGKITQPGDMIIYVAGFPAIYGTQPLYFQDETFTVRAKVNPPSTSDQLTGLRDTPNA